ncbi:MAG TPA: penicillin acylase family protein [Candidatus Acidoferrum sp.]|nr:penicillin acylase family protein [Candidatus Acidoferrum sp.]
MTLRTVLRVFYWIFAIIVIAVAAVTWWFVYRPLPQIDGTVSLPGLQHDVTVERDGWGVPHIRAASVEDLAETQGYVMAQDRLWQMDLLRRIARGQLSEILGQKTIKIDKDFRTLGLGHAADREATVLEPEARKIMESYARGVNKFVEQHERNLPLEFSLLRYKPQPWQPSDTLAISGYMYRVLTNIWERKLNRAKVTEHIGADRAKDLFFSESTLDHVVVGDPNVVDDGSQRSAADPDDDDDDDMQPDAVLKASLDGPRTPSVPDKFPDLASALAESVREFLVESRNEIRQGLGSNNWVVSGAHTATGKPLLANDTHLELTIPPIWYEVHLTAPGWNVKGFALPGAPMVVIGHNERIAWGFTNNYADVQDLYIESFISPEHDNYRVNAKGGWAKAQTFDEVISVKGQSDEHLKVVVTRHGPIVHEEAGKAYALRWTALESGGLANSYLWVGKARNWKEFRDTMKRVWGPAQNAVYADVDGNIGYMMAARVPVRKKGHGEVPVPGDTDDYEWTGYIPFEQLPRALNPDSGLIVTANSRVVGPNYKPYLTDQWEEPYRTARIYDLLHDRHDLRTEDMLKVQTDAYSYPHVFLADQLMAAAKTAKPSDARAQALIDGLKDWNGIADARSTEVSFLHATQSAALELLLKPFLGADTPLYQWRSTLFLQKMLTDRPARWLPVAYKNYDELLAAAADLAVSKLAEESKSERVHDWEWKRFNPLEMFHPLGREGILKRLLSITGKPQSGTAYSVGRAKEHVGPAMRFVANPANWDESILLVPAGQSGQPGSSHYSDQFSYWYEGKPIFAPFSDVAEAAARKHILTLKPGT